MEKDEGPVEEVERRHDLRGPTQGLGVILAGDRFEALEASRRAFFIAAGDPDRFRLGEVLDARVGHDGRAASCRLEVIRKEIEPRRGVALRLITIDPANEAVLRELLGAVAD